MTLAPKQFEAAKRFILEYARPLENALFRFHFESGSLDQVFEELRRFQNTDGGYGHGLEADLRTPLSSVLCTNFALEYLRSVQAKTEHAERAVLFLVKSFDSELRSWRIIPLDSQQFPHAPWWRMENLDERFDNYRVNPKFEVLSHILAYRDCVPEFAIDDLVEESIQLLPASTTNVDKHDIESCIRLAESERILASQRERLTERLLTWIPRIVERNPHKWSEYCLQPLDVVSSGNSPFLSLLEEEVNRAIEYQLNNQNDTGSWEPNWHWLGTFPEEWTKAKAEWAGVLTLKMLVTLTSFDI